DWGLGIGNRESGIGNRESGIVRASRAHGFRCPGLAAVG
ncbi:AraC family transcriptional regulator, partial [Xanthomonas campestris pv. raphani]